MSVRDKWVRRFSVDETSKHKNGFTIYKITSVLFPLESPEAVTVVSVWKRYSDIQRLHKAMRALHAGLRLRGTFPQLAKWSYFKRFDKEVIEERANTIKSLLQFVAEHRLLFASTEFVNFLQSGYPAPAHVAGSEGGGAGGGVIDSIRSSLQLPAEEVPPLEYQTDDDDDVSVVSGHTAPASKTIDTTDGHTSTLTIDNPIDVSSIEIFEAADVETRHSAHHRTESVDSLSSLESLSSDLYDQLSKVTVPCSKPLVKSKSVLPDLINFDAPPSNSKFEDYHTMRRPSSTVDASHDVVGERRYTGSDPGGGDYSVTGSDPAVAYGGSSVMGCDPGGFGASITGSKSGDGSSVTRSDPYAGSSVMGCDPGDSVTGSDPSCVGPTGSDPGGVGPAGSDPGGGVTDDSCYVFEAGHLLNVAARCEQLGHYRRAFHYYKAGIERMLLGVRADGDRERRALVKSKSLKYIAHADRLYTTRLLRAGDAVSSAGGWSGERHAAAAALRGALPARLLRRPYDDLALYRFLGVLADTVMLVLHTVEQTCYVIKVVQKIPNNLTEFDEPVRASETGRGVHAARASETMQPILPTNVPYMVPLHAYIETEHLYFLVLGYAPGEKLLDYVQHYNSTTSTTHGERPVNLENVLADPLRLENRNENDNITPATDDIRLENRNENDNITLATDDFCLENRNDNITSATIDFRLKNRNENDNITVATDDFNDDISIVDRLEANKRLISNSDRSKVRPVADLMKNDGDKNETEKLDVSVNELVMNSQRLLRKVDKVLSDELKAGGDDFKCDDEGKEIFKDIKVINAEANPIDVRKLTVELNSPLKRTAWRCRLPPGAVVTWAAELLTALESLHNCGVVCRDLRPCNVLLGAGGHVTLTYFIGYSGAGAALLSTRRRRRADMMYIAPELHHYPCRLLPAGGSEGEQGGSEGEPGGDKVADYWSFGAILYELICGVPLWYYHRSVFTAHTLLQLPDGIDVEAQSILTQLLTATPGVRLGGGAGGADEIKRHPYFKHVHWTRVYTACCQLEEQ